LFLSAIQPIKVSLSGQNGETRNANKILVKEMSWKAVTWEIEKD